LNVINFLMIKVLRPMKSIIYFLLTTFFFLISSACSSTKVVDNPSYQEPIHVLLQVRNDNKDKDFSQKIFRRIAQNRNENVQYHSVPSQDIEYDILGTIVITDVDATESTKTFSNSFISNSPQGRISTNDFPTRQGDGNSIAVVFAGGNVPVRPARQVSSTTVSQNVRLGAQVIITNLKTGEELQSEYFFDEEESVGPKVSGQRTTEEMMENSMEDLSRMIVKYFNNNRVL